MKRLIAAAVSCLLLTASATYGATYACVKKKGGNVRIVSATARCLKSERKISWPDAAEFAALQSLLQHFSRNGNDITITGANLWITNGLGSTSGGDPKTVNGLGNLVIGYNRPRASWGGNDERTGSHNLIIGDSHNYTSYGGMVTGLANEIFAPYASVSGYANSANGGECASVSGGFGNIASGLGSTVSGGFANSATGKNSSVSGGSYNTASGAYSSVGGGRLNDAIGDYSTVSGGNSRSAPNEDDWAAADFLRNY